MSSPRPETPQPSPGSVPAAWQVDLKSIHPLVLDKFDNPKALLAAADSALYHSKRNGRDRYTCYETIQAA